MALEDLREEGAEPRSPGRVAGSCPALTVLPRGSLVRLAPGHQEPAGSPPLSEGTPTSPFWLPSCLCHTAVQPGTGRDPHPCSAACRSPSEGCSLVGAAGLTPMGGQLSQET